MKQSNESANDTTLQWLRRLSAHFNTELSEDQVEIYVSALAKNTPYQINEGFERCLNECQFMPKLAEFHQRMPEQKWPTENLGGFTPVGPPITDLVRPIAREICKEFCGREYDSLDTFKDAKLIHDVFAAANRIRYERMGIDTRKFGTALTLSMESPKEWEEQKAELRVKGWL